MEALVNRGQRVRFAAGAEGDENGLEVLGSGDGQAGVRGELAVAGQRREIAGGEVVGEPGVELFCPGIDRGFLARQVDGAQVVDDAAAADDGDAAVAEGARERPMRIRSSGVVRYGWAISTIGIWASGRRMRSGTQRP